MEDHMALMARLTEGLAEVGEQNALLRDQLARSNWRIEQLEARWGLLRAALTGALAEDAPMLTSLDDALAEIGELPALGVDAPC
jgi:hypothetical protein